MTSKFIKRTWCLSRVLKIYNSRCFSLRSYTIFYQPMLHYINSILKSMTAAIYVLKSNYTSIRNLSQRPAVLDTFYWLVVHKKQHCNDALWGTNTLRHHRHRPSVSWFKPVYNNCKILHLHRFKKWGRLFLRCFLSYPQKQNTNRN